MTTKDDLIAAKALMDTPEKMALMVQDPSPLFDALHETCPTEVRFWEAREALMNAANVRSLGATRSWPHDRLMSALDRAIEAA